MEGDFVRELAPIDPAIAADVSRAFGRRALAGVRRWFRRYPSSLVTTRDSAQALPGGGCRPVQPDQHRIRLKPDL